MLIYVKNNIMLNYDSIKLFLTIVQYESPQLKLA